MKKLVFTALAVVAFSATSFAGTKEVSEKKILFTDCVTTAAQKTSETEASSGRCYSPAQWQMIYKINYDKCMQENKITEA
ncbi:hypothetical protein [Flavobacterium sp. K5-23]|uniref:hypothetical protein n=1 Tax=Flavobacterium sp. K5-23 TaxID=2746225 RepID=UPI00200EF8E6|nr:hypothetical protein [Flavobacterium sp. K5-23]UQD55254.1 hypothetical protein FLAK523_02145 [Flavobacterium sp. K5-23]